MKSSTLSILATASLVFAVGASSVSAPLPVKVTTYKDVAPTITKYCVPCHQGKDAAHGLDLKTYASTMKGDKKGKVVIAGQVAKSRLSTVLHGKPEFMPPDGKLKTTQVALIEAWIKAGAKEK